MQVVQNLFFIENQGTTFKMEGHMSKAAGIVGKGALAFTGEFYGTFQFAVQLIKLRYRITGPLYEGTTFFS